MRLVLTTGVDLDLTVRKRWDVLIRQRQLSKEMWRRGELDIDQHGDMDGYLTKDPTRDSYSASPGRYRKDYLRYYSQTKDSHEAIAMVGRGYKDQQFYYEKSGRQLPPLLEQMLRTNLLTFDDSLDMMQRLTGIQTFITFMTGYDLAHLYPHLWIGVKIRLMNHSYEYDEDDHNYRFSPDEWSLPFDFTKEKLVDLIRQYLHAYHAENPQGLALLEKVK